MTYLVFVSHSGDDTWLARQIAHQVERQGARTFLDEANVAIGAEFEDEVLTALGQAHELIALFTPWSLQRPYVWAEIGAAWIRRIPIVAVLHGVSAAEFVVLPHVPIFLKKRDLVVLNDIDHYFSQLARRIAAAGDDCV